MIEELDEIKQIINDAEAILITAGAGMGVDSGLPDFRGNEGFWNAYPIAKKLNLGFQDLANPIWFTTNPPMAWAFYGNRYNLYKNTIPHDGFKMLLDLVKSKNDNYFIFTSNIDGQFQKAGFDENKIVECHGSISFFQCSNDCRKEIWEANEEFDIDIEKFESITIPLCPRCGDIARPNILMFVDWKWNPKKTLNQETRYVKWKRENKGKKLLIIELGAGTAIPTVRRESENLAKYYNGNLIRINPKEFDVDENYGYSIPFDALEGLKTIL
uniref:SIR2 family NAD-dependent protein deacylase n=1 Tax=Aliarcobacter sp. TaxID=2321116 RepID=UPI0040473DC8